MPLKEKVRLRWVRRAGHGTAHRVGRKVLPDRSADGLPTRHEVGMKTVTVSKFPALTIKNGTVDLVFSEEQLTSCTAQALKNGWFNGLTIVDSEGKRYIVERA